MADSVGDFERNGSEIVRGCDRLTGSGLRDELCRLSMHGNDRELSAGCRVHQACVHRNYVSGVQRTGGNLLRDNTVAAAETVCRWHADAACGGGPGNNCAGRGYAIV